MTPTPGADGATRPAASAGPLFVAPSTSSDPITVGAGGLRPVWLLDVDGVLNATRPGWGGSPRSGRAFANGVGWPMRFAPALMSRLRAVHGSGDVEIRWATTWVDDIDQITTLMGLPRWECAFSLTRAGSDAISAKHAAALHVVRTEGRPLVWTDDEVVPIAGSYPDRRLRTAGPPVLLIRPRKANGLQPNQLDEIEEFVAGSGRR
jgi:hypothetical protein